MPDLHQVGIIAHVHCLPSFENLLVNWLFRAGFEPENIFIIPKPYSTIESVCTNIRNAGAFVAKHAEAELYSDYGDLSGKILEQGFRAAIGRARYWKKVLLIDDGGLLTDAWARSFKRELQNVVSIQQTSSGTKRRLLHDWGIPFIDVARSAAKLVFESRIIANGVTRKLSTLPEFGSRVTAGLVGVGALGSEVVRSLRRQDIPVLTFDKVRHRVPVDGEQICLTLSELISGSDVILGCTGWNWLSESRVSNLIRKPHTLISCSSRSVEFQTLLERRSPVIRNRLFDDLEISLQGSSKQLILNGGFPINFDRKKEWETETEISLTRGLILGAILQATTFNRNSGETVRIKLNADFQMQVVREWLTILGEDCTNFGVEKGDFDDVSWWHQNSSGI